MQKSLKYVKKYFQRQFLKVTKCAKITKITPNERGDQTHSFGVVFVIFAHLVPFKN